MKIMKAPSAKIARAPKLPSVPKMSIPKGHTPIVNDANFTDARPTIGGKSTVYNPDGSLQAGPLPNGPPRNISVPGRQSRDAVPIQDGSNKRF